MFGARATVVFAVSVSVLLVGLAGCDNPKDDGRTLGRQHVDLVRRDALTYERMTADLEAHRQKYRSNADQRAFESGYEEAVEPVKVHIAALVVAHRSKQAGAAIAVGLEDLGQGLGRLVQGVADAVSKKSGEVDSGAVDPEEMKRIGREVGAFLRGLVERSGAFVEGLEERLERFDAPAPEAKSKEP